MLNRRDCLGGALALAACGVPVRAATVPSASSATDVELRAALDALLRTNATRSERLSTAESLAKLAGFDITALSPASAIDLATVRAGLMLDAALAAATTAGNSTRIYALRIERSLGERINPAAAHQLLQTEVTRLTGRADQLLRALGLRQGSVGSRLQTLAVRPEQLYSADETGRDALVAYMNDWLDHSRARLPRQFAAVPDYCLQVQVERLSAAETAAGKPGYRRLPEPGVPGAYVIDLRDLARRPRWTLPSVVYHELLPGHLLQLPLEVAAGAHALRLEYTHAFSEGWATYAEELAALDGAYQPDPAAELGLVHWLLFRALRGLADTGVHHAGWSADAALARLHEWQGFAVYFAAFDDDIRRIVAEPATRTAEALAWLRLRTLASAAARRSRRREFHTLALQYGRQPLALLAQRAERL